jgi:uncharacterized protein
MRGLLSGQRPGVRRLSSANMVQMGHETPVIAWRSIAGSGSNDLPGVRRGKGKVRMKPSIYNFLWPTDDPGKMMIFNSMSTALVEVTSSFLELLQAPRFDYDRLSPRARRFADQLKDGGFFLEETIDELDKLKRAVDALKYDETNLALTIAPTLRCNFACTYCYEQAVGTQERRDGRHAIMPQAVRAELLNWIERRARRVKTLSVSWFGGEPLMAKDVIFELSEKMIRIADENGIDYHAGMITNGYLLGRDPEIIAKLVKSRISFFQITLDGPPEVHDARRKLKRSNRSTFGPVLDGIRLLADSGMNVAVRVNVDRTNREQVLQVPELLSAHGIENVSLTLGRVTLDAGGCPSMGSACTSMQEFSDLNRALERRVRSGKFKVGHSLYYPRSANNICAPNRLMPLAIDPDGELYKCWHEIGDKAASIGNILDFEHRGAEQIARETRWVAWEAFAYPDCRACKLLPICLGGCPYGPVINGEQPECAEWKYGLEHHVRARYAAEKRMVSELATAERTAPELAGANSN